MVSRGEIWWADLPDPVASGPGYRRPVLVIQSDSFNRSSINTVIALAITSNLQLAEAPGNVSLPAKRGGLGKDSVVNVSQVVTVDRKWLHKKCGKLDPDTMTRIDDGIRLALSL